MSIRMHNHMDVGKPEKPFVEVVRKTKLESVVFLFCHCRKDPRIIDLGTSKNSWNHHHLNRTELKDHFAAGLVIVEAAPPAAAGIKLYRTSRTVDTDAAKSAFHLHFISRTTRAQQISSFISCVCLRLIIRFYYSLARFLWPSRTSERYLLLVGLGAMWTNDERTEEWVNVSLSIGQQRNAPFIVLIESTNPFANKYLNERRRPIGHVDGRMVRWDEGACRW